MASKVFALADLPQDIPVLQMPGMGAIDFWQILAAQRLLCTDALSVSDEVRRRVDAWAKDDERA
jgi:hypothetical protein